MPECIVSAPYEHQTTSRTYTYEKGATEKPIPWVFWIKSVPSIDKDRPLVTADQSFSISKFVLGPGFNLLE